MYIISKEKDYYDYLSQIYGVDKKVVYKRNQQEIEGNLISHSVERKIERNGSTETYYINYDFIYLCDKVYPFIFIEKLLGDDTWIYYDYDAVLMDWPELKPTDDSHKWRRFFRNEKTYDPIRDHFDCKSSLKLSEKYNTKFNTPQLLAHGVKFYTDIILKDYDFSKQVSPEQAFQLVSMFVAAKPEQLQTIPTDLDRFEAKGFDRKTSFRRM